MQTDVSLAAVRDRELEWTLQDELSRLPDKYRAPLSLCYLEDKSRRDAAAELECTEAAVKARLARGRKLLRNRLMRRGVALSIAMSSAGASTASAATHVSSVLVEQTVEGCGLYASGAEMGAAVSKNAVSLAREEMNAMLLSSIVKSSAAAASIALLTALAVVGVKGNFASAQVDQSKPETVVAAAADAAEKQPPTTIRVPAGKKQATGDANAPTTSFETFRRPSEKKIVQALQNETVLEFIDAPLRDVVENLKDTHDILILIDDVALDEVGIGTDTPITINLRGVTLRSCLRWLLRPLELTYTIQDEALLITTPEKAETMLCTRIYPVRELLAQNEDGSFDMDSLMELITAVVKPESWTEVGGPGAIAAVTFSGVDMLVVSQAYYIQEEVDEFLAQLRSMIDAERRK